MKNEFNQYILHSSFFIFKGVIKVNKLIRSNEKGFTMIEALMATVLIVFASTSTMSLFIAGYKYTAISGQIVTATNVARSKIELMRDTAFEDIPGTFPGSSPIAVDNLPNGQWYVTYPGGTGTDPLNVLVTVEWTERGTPHSIDLATLVTNTNL